MRQGGTARPDSGRQRGRRGRPGKGGRDRSQGQLDLKETSTPRPAGGARLVTIGGGKGGVGKSFLAANLAAAIASEGHAVVVVDGDLEGANLHTCLGMPAPPASLADFAAGREHDLAKLAFETSVPGLRLIAGTHANLATPQPSHQQRVRMMRELRRLDADFVIVDLGAGTASATIDYFTVGDDELLVIQPEPTSVENAYAFLRAAFYRRMRIAMHADPVRQLVSEAMDQRNERGIRTPLDLLREVQELDPEDGTRFVQSMRAFRPRVVMNGVRSAEDIRVGFAVRSVCRKYFGIDAEYLGYVNQDEAVHRSVLARKPLVLSEPRTNAAVYVGRIAHKLCDEHAVRVGSARQERARESTP